MDHHYEGDDLIVRKIRVGEMENNVYLLEDPATHDALLVDGCFEPDAILEACEGANIAGIVQTHGHYDHVQALPELKERLGVPVYAHAGEDYPVTIDEPLRHEQRVAFGRKEAKVLHTPGHT
ncbi:MAG: MBL fold metallo-hydrolase, partial [Actinobacteria bacterium]|nr:MBL fold metallo-hydrolase [Actinomycetota bacterium]